MLNDYEKARNLYEIYFKSSHILQIDWYRSFYWFIYRFTLHFYKTGYVEFFHILHNDIQGVSEGIVNILGSGSVDYSE
jgi:hypothetical protein